MKKILPLILTLASVAFAGAAPEAPGEYEATNLPKAAVLESAKFRWWAPEGKQVRGVLVLVPGRGGDGRGLSADSGWREFATKNNFGIVACFFKGDKSDEKAYQMDTDGAISDLINKAVAAELEQNGQKVRNPPLAFWGHSAGGNITQEYLLRYSGRVIGAVADRCPGGPGAYASGKGDVPLLVVVGKKDKPEWVAESLANYEKGRSSGALWTLAAHPKEGHELGKDRPLVIAYLNSAVALRFPASATKPTRLNRSAGWLGDPVSLEVGEISKFKGKKKDAVWLLNEDVAKAWAEYLKP